MGLTTKHESIRFAIYKRNMIVVVMMPALYCLRYRSQPPENRNALKLNLLRSKDLILRNTER